MALDGFRNRAGKRVYWHAERESRHCRSIPLDGSDGFPRARTTARSNRMALDATPSEIVRAAIPAGKGRDSGSLGPSRRVMRPAMELGALFF
jgi:hypothetical protein